MITGVYLQQADATPRQKQAIASLCRALGIKDEVEQRPMTSGAAGKLVRELTNQMKANRKEQDVH